MRVNLIAAGLRNRGTMTDLISAIPKVPESVWLRFSAFTSHDPRRQRRAKPGQPRSLFIRQRILCCRRSLLGHCVPRAQQRETARPQRPVYALTVRPTTATRRSPPRGRGPCRATRFELFYSRDWDPRANIHLPALPVSFPAFSRWDRCSHGHPAPEIASININTNLNYRGGPALPEESCERGHHISQVHAGENPNVCSSTSDGASRRERWSNDVGRS